MEVIFDTFLKDQQTLIHPVKETVNELNRFIRFGIKQFFLLFYQNYPYAVPFILINIILKRDKKYGSAAS